MASKKRPAPVQRVTRAKRRCCLTHIAMICDQPSIQPQLPQFILGNESTFLARALPALKAAAPPNVRLLRLNSAWNNEGVCLTVVRALAKALEPHAAVYQTVFFLDAVRIHTTARVFQACRRAGIWPIVVPAKMTFLMQPLDTDAFLLYKLGLQQAYQEARAHAPGGDVSVNTFLECVYGVIRGVLQSRRWAGAFDRDGFGHVQAELSSALRKGLRIDGPLTIGDTQPSVEQLSLCFSRRLELPLSALPSFFSGGRASRGARSSGSASPASSAAGRAPSAPSAPMSAPSVAPVGLTLGRTRSETRALGAVSRGAVAPRGKALPGFPKGRLG